MNTYKHDEECIERILIEEDLLREKIRELGLQITQDYADSEIDLILVGILKGSVMFMAELAKHVHVPLKFDFMSVSSYGDGTVSTGNVRILKDLDQDITGKDVLIVEDIIDSGNTLSYIKESLGKRGAHSVKIVTLLNKKARREQPLEAEYCGFDIPDVFVVGFGLDYAEFYRNLPFIGVLKEEVYSS